MKRILLFLFLLIPFSVFADTVKLTCPDEIASGEEFTCSIEGNTNGIIISVDMNARFGSNLKMISFVPDGKWSGDGASGYIRLYTYVDVNESFKIGTLKLRNDSGSNNSVILDEIKFYYDDDSFLELNSITKNIKIKSTTNSSNSNSNSNKSDTSSGNTKVDNNSDSKKDTKSDNTTNKNEDNNQDNVDSTDSDVYGNAYLVDIILGSYDIPFEKDVYEYELAIKDENKLDIEPVLMDSSSKYSITGNNKLKNGSVIEIKVTATNGDTETYKIKIIKEEKSSNIYKIVFIGIIGILVIINIIRVVSRRRK